MNPEIKANWVEALRSKEYPQTTGALRRTVGNYRQAGFCCLGVLTDLAVKAGVCKWEIDSSGIGGVKEYSDRIDADYFNMAELPKAVIEWAELESADPKVVVLHDEGFDIHTTLGGLNDYYHYNFDQIADVIKAKL